MADDSINTMRTCSKCGVEKPATFENFDNYRDRGKVRQRAFCRECLRARLRNYRAENPDKAAEWDRRNQERNRGAGSAYEKRRYARKDKVKASEKLKDWKAKNPEKVRAAWERTYSKHKHKHHDRMVRWLRANPQKAAAIRNRRRARAAEAAGDYTIADVRALLRKHGRICFYCGTTLAEFHVDHFIPLARGGANGPENLRISCPPCNWSKGGKMPWDWMPDKFRCDETA